MKMNTQMGSNRNVQVNRHKILIADDEPDIRDLLGDFLEGEGYECILANDAYDALEKFRTTADIDLVMSDIRMPGKTGLELLSELKRTDEDVMVVMISAVKDIEPAIAAMSKGAYDYVSKPFQLSEVAQIAKKALEKRRLLLENKEYQRDLEKKVKERTADLNRTLEELDRTYQSTLIALVAALETRDKETRGHSYRVVRYSLKIAELMGITDEQQLKVLKYGALLHDIGKIGIPDAILKKKSGLSPSEWQKMKDHPRIGYRILRKIKFLEEAAAQIVLHHHEYYDGTGYPNGLKGKQIPLGSRIFLVADVIDAITSERSYRGPLPFETVSRELTQNVGKQFDPEVVAAFHSIDLSFWKEERERLDRKFMSTGIFDFDS